MPTMMIALGPDERVFEVEYDYHPAERPSSDDPGCDAWADIIDAVVVEDDGRRELTDEERDLLYDRECEVSDKAVDAFSRWWE